MHIKSLHTGEDVDPKEEIKMKKNLGDQYVTENQRNSSQETKQTLGTEEAKGPLSTLYGSKKVWLGAVVMVVVLAGVGAGVSLASSPHILHMIGFTSRGLASKSFASRLMSSTSSANNHTVPKHSWVSWLQKAGQKGPTPEHQAYFATGGAFVGVMVGVAMVVITVVAYSVFRRYIK